MRVGKECKVKKYVITFLTRFGKLQEKTVESVWKDKLIHILLAGKRIMTTATRSPSSHFTQTLARTTTTADSSKLSLIYSSPPLPPTNIQLSVSCETMFINVGSKSDILQLLSWFFLKCKRANLWQRGCSKTASSIFRWLRYLLPLGYLHRVCTRK